MVARKDGRQICIVYTIDEGHRALYARFTRRGNVGLSQRSLPNESELCVDILKGSDERTLVFPIKLAANIDDLESFARQQIWLLLREVVQEDLIVDHLNLVAMSRLTKKPGRSLIFRHKAVCVFVDELLPSKSLQT